MEKVCSKCKVPQDSQKEFSPRSTWCKACNRVYALWRKRKLKASESPAFILDRMRKSDEDRFIPLIKWPAFCKNTPNPRDLLLYDLTQSCGLRIHEALVLAPKDFNFDRGFVAIHTLKQRQGLILIHTVPVRPDLLKKLADLANGPNERYFPITYDTARNHFRKVAALTQLGEHLGINSLRRLFGTRVSQECNGNRFEIDAALRHKPSDFFEGPRKPVLETRIWELIRATWLKQPWVWKDWYGK